MYFPLPFELINKVFDYVRTDIPIIDKEDLKSKTKIYHTKSNFIKKWYKKYKIEDKMPILFLTEVQNMEKWHLIRLFMKFYPKSDLYDWPLYYYSGHVIKKNFVPYKKTNKAYEVYKFMKQLTKNEIINTGF